MKRVTMYQTADGQVHSSEERAAHYANERYGSALTALAHRAIQQQKYTEMVTFIEENLAAFAELKALQEDIHVEPSLSTDNDD